jgi:hypothetical protein
VIFINTKIHLYLRNITIAHTNLTPLSEQLKHKYVKHLLSL